MKLLLRCLEAADGKPDVPLFSMRGRWKTLPLLAAKVVHHAASWNLPPKVKTFQLLLSTAAAKTNQMLIYFGTNIKLRNRQSEVMPDSVFIHLQFLNKFMELSQLFALL